MTWVKTSIITPGKRKNAWAIPYRGFLIVRQFKQNYTITVPGTGKRLPWTFGDVMNAKCYIDGAHYMAKEAGGLDLTLPVKEIKQRYASVFGEAWQGYCFCWPELDEKRAKTLQKLSDERAARYGLTPSGRTVTSWRDYLPSPPESGRNAGGQP